VPDAVPIDIVVSPDGAFVYVLMARNEVGAVAVYRRDRGNGRLTFAGCVADGGESACSPAHGLAGAQGIAISPDGRSVYVAAYFFQDGGTVTTLTRDATGGGLTQPDGIDGCLAATPYPDCGQGPSLSNPTSIAVSHDGGTVYVVYGGSVLADFARDSDSGAIGYGACLASGRAGCAKARGVHAFNQVTITVDGRYMYLGGLRELGVFAVG
jgi:DNA-binding beta-propeller fold protein YncE